MKKYLKKSRVEFLNTEFNNISIQELFELLDYYFDSQKSGYMVSLNVDMLVKIENNPLFREAFLSSDAILMDSTPLMKLASRCGVECVEKLSGSDLMIPICEYAAKRCKSIFVLGGAEGVPEKACSNLGKAIPDLRIAGCYSPKFGFDSDEVELMKVFDIVNEANADILFVCLGAPKSELLAYKWRAMLDSTFMFCIGAAVDFVAENAKRAPVWMQKAGLEWFYRFTREPKRLFKRYFVDSWTMVRIIHKGLRKR